jgi:hypothetical protein
MIYTVAAWLMTGNSFGAGVDHAFIAQSFGLCCGEIDYLIRFITHTVYGDVQ